MKRSIFTLFFVVAFTFLSGAVIYQALENTGLLQNPNTSGAIKNVLRFALGVPVTILQLVAVKYATELTKNL